MKYHFELQGVTPLLMHADDVELSDRLSAWRKDPKNKGVGKTGDDRSPAWTWQTYLYTDGEHIVVPTDNLAVCLREAGAMISLKGKTTFKGVSQSSIFFSDDFLPLMIDGNAVKASVISGMQDLTFDEQREECRKLGFDLFVKRAKIGTSKHIRVRPRFNQWTLSGSVEVTAKEITQDILQEMFSLGGRFKGLCDWRPSSKQSPGRFGMFEAKVTKG